MTRQRGRFAGFSLYVSKTGSIQGSIPCYKDGPELPLLNFAATCTEYGRYVIFFNERLDEGTYPSNYEIQNVYTELCEVIVLGNITYIKYTTSKTNQMYHQWYMLSYSYSINFQINSETMKLFFLDLFSICFRKNPTMLSVFLFDR